MTSPAATVEHRDDLVRKALGQEFEVVSMDLSRPGLVIVIVSTPCPFGLYYLEREDALYRRLAQLGEIVEQAEKSGPESVR